MSNIKVEMLSVNDFDNICRTCSTESDLVSLFDNIETLSMLESFTQMQFSKTDELPDKICANCITKINECFHFINNCKIIEEALRKCLNENIKQLEEKAEELHSSFDIKQDEEPSELSETINEEPTENIKQTNVKQSDYYILKWGTPSENQENKQCQLTVINNPSNEQDRNEQQTLRRLQILNRLRKFRARRHNSTSDTTENRRKTLTFSQTDETTDNIAHQQANDIEPSLRRAKIEEEPFQRAPIEEPYRARVKLTLPHDDHAELRRNFETPERIVLERALARDQFRKYRSKLTADETAEHRAQVCENIHKYRVKLHNEDVDRDYSAEKQLQIPLRLSEMAQTLLKPREVEVSAASEHLHKMSRFSLRPTKIPQVKKQCYETRLHANENQHITKFRSWKRLCESTDEVTVRLTKNAIQRKQFCSSLKEPMHVEESALRRAKAAGQLREYRPILRKNKTVTLPHAQIGK